MKNIVTLIFLFNFAVLFTAQADTYSDSYQFDSSDMEQTFQKLSNELRCLVCQNQSIADSNADLAKDLRQEIYSMLQAGKTEAEIIDFMVYRYGDFVLYRPPVKPVTWVLWFGPVIIFFLGLFIAIKNIKNQPNSVNTGLSDTEKSRLDGIIKGRSTDDKDTHK